MDELIGKYCIERNINGFGKEIHIITGVHPKHRVMVELDNNKDSLFHYERALFISSKENLVKILELQEKYLKAKESLEFQLKCLNEAYSKQLKELWK